MKLSDYAKQAEIIYQTLWRIWKRGLLNAYFQIVNGIQNSGSIKVDEATAALGILIAGWFKVTATKTVSLEVS